MVSLCLVQFGYVKSCFAGFVCDLSCAKAFFYVDPPKEDIFVTTLYGLYFNSDVIHVTNFYLGL